MPRIAAPTLHQHREQTLAALIDAAADLLRAGDGRQITAGAVTRAVGMSRNSLYRYVDSVDDLLVLVLNQHLPLWTGTVESAIASAANPHEQVLAYVRSNLELGGPGGEAWLMRMAGGIAARARAELAGVHEDLGRMLTSAVAATGVGQPALVERIVGGIVSAGLARLDAGDDPRAVIERCVRSAAAVLSA
ncbi:TetR/AcrR family transcriptional regulator [Propionibacteriaceae bacterium G1746]|uniref:TetR/AcrR family transcriptional regulator n=1 Tax=Aestuariimicrobium sp. G57 TaxID=3418485 RepID=UPI003C2795B2